MKYLKKFEGIGDYYNDPPDDEDPLFEGVLDRVWGMFADIDKIEEDIIEEYIEMLWSDHYQVVYELIYKHEEELSVNGKYPWTKELDDEYTHKKYGRDMWRKRQDMDKSKLQDAISKKIYEDVKVLYPIDDFEVKYNAKKYNL